MKYGTLWLSLFLSLTPLAARESAPPAQVPTNYAKEIKVTPLLITSTTDDGKPIVYPKGDPEVRVMMVEVPPGKETGWHIHPLPCYGYILSGSITVTLEDGTSKTFTEGQALAEVVNTPHIGVNPGTEPTKILMVVVGEKGVPMTEILKASRFNKAKKADEAKP